MAMPAKFLAASLLLSLLVLHFSEADHDPVNSNLAASSPPKKIDCGSACKARCQLSSRPRLCKRACGSCCSTMQLCSSREQPVTMRLAPATPA
ncbi:hypothetical protein OIU84_013798 [Salix udensis]|uniref:Uncharacterized protein n=1 Tax=Salix udensis TaxID=889485 RepID=A0AAD6JKW3_9ROSI|nr:hypothetical protein OIU84_013798 [Salix udensis]